MIIYILAAVSMPIIATFAFLLGQGGQADLMTELQSFRWLGAFFASAFYSLAMIHAKKVTGIWAARFYSFEVISPFILIAVCSFIGLMPIYTIFAYLTLPVAMGCSKTILNAVNTKSDIVHDLVPRTATLQTIFTVILSIILLIF